MPDTTTYRSTFILDTRGQEKPVDELIDSLKEEIAAVQGTVSEVENLGQRDFVRVPDKRYTAGVYVRVDYAAPLTAPAALHERLRLNKLVSHHLLERL
ncbi:MAG: 30S ribosomal protein S6, partial [Puniceicoccaceae bacterium]